MKTILDVEDLRNIVNNIYNGNLEAIKSGLEEDYVNPMSEPITLIDEDGAKTEKDLAQFLNISFYSWKKRIAEKQGELNEDDMTAWINSVNHSLNEAYALVEVLDEEVTASQDIDASNITGRITFLIQTEKMPNLDYYIRKIRNTYLGVPQTIQNSFGDNITAFIVMGIPTFDQDPTMTPVGECTVCSCNFRISYLGDAQTSSDTQVLISLDGDDTYSGGEIVGETHYMEMPITKTTHQRIFTKDPVPMAQRPDLTGSIVKAVANTMTISFYDFNKTLTNRFNALFWRLSAIKVDGYDQVTQEVNIPVFIKIVNGGHFYIYKCVVANMEKVITNGDFNICSISLDGWGKLA